MEELSIATLSRQVAEAKGHKKSESGKLCYCAMETSGTAHWYPNFADPARLYELEGELQQAGWQFFFNDSWNIYRAYDRDQPPFTYPGTPEGRARLILRATLEIKR